MSTKPDTARPKMGSDMSMLCPPASAMPASAQVSRAPARTLLAISGASVSTGQPKIAIATVGVPPMA